MTRMLWAGLAALLTLSLAVSLSAGAFAWTALERAERTSVALRESEEKLAEQRELIEATIHMQDASLKGLEGVVENQQGLLRLYTISTRRLNVLERQRTLAAFRQLTVR
jgi:hypothetical protein